MKHILIFLVLATLYACQQPQTASDTFDISEMKFRGHLASRKNMKDHTYSVIGRGFNFPEAWEGKDAFIQDWVKNHPNAKISIIATMVDTMNKAAMSYVWVTDGKESLNEQLVKKGFFRRNLMFRPKTWEEMNEAEKAGSKNTPKLLTTIFVDPKVYTGYLNELETAEMEAQKNKVGLWSKPWVEEDNIEVTY